MNGVKEMNNYDSFLKIGYDLDYTEKRYDLDFSNINKKKYEHATEEELINIGTALFNNAISKQFRSSEKNIVPLSGGLDSRAILGALLNHTSAKNITTYTFGTPGTLDYEIGNNIAKNYGTKHISIDLTKLKYSMEDLIEMSNRVDHQTVLFHHPPTFYLDSIIEDSYVWSGAIIDVFFGRHKHHIKSNNIADAKRNFIKENIYQNKINLTNNEILLDKIECDEKVAAEIGYEHHIDLVNRQLKYIAPHVLANGYNYKVLFTDSELVNFSLDLDNKYIEDQNLYIKILTRSFPELFELPCKTSYGKRITSSKFNIELQKKFIRLKIALSKKSPFIENPLVNYIDYSKEIREREDLTKIVRDNILDLKSRNIIDWIDVEKIWNDYYLKKEDYSGALLLLASLEIHIKAKECKTKG